MKLRERIVELEAYLADADARERVLQAHMNDFCASFETAVQNEVESRLDALIADPPALRAAILNHASLAHSPNDLMTALRALDAIDHV